MYTCILGALSEGSQADSEVAGSDAVADQKVRRTIIRDKPRFYKTRSPDGYDASCPSNLPWEGVVTAGPYSAKAAGKIMGRGDAAEPPRTW